MFVRYARNIFKSHQNIYILDLFELAQGRFLYSRTQKTYIILFHLVKYATLISQAAYSGAKEITFKYRRLSTSSHCRLFLTGIFLRLLDMIIYCLFASRREYS